MLRIKLGQIEDSIKDVSGAKRPNLKASTIMMSKGVRTNSKRCIGVVPVVEIRDIC